MTTTNEMITFNEMPVPEQNKNTVKSKSPP